MDPLTRNGLIIAGKAIRNHRDGIAFLNRVILRFDEKAEYTVAWLEDYVVVCRAKAQLEMGLEEWKKGLST